MAIRNNALNETKERTQRGGRNQLDSGASDAAPADTGNEGEGDALEASSKDDAAGAEAEFGVEEVRGSAGAESGPKPHGRWCGVELTSSML